MLSLSPLAYSDSLRKRYDALQSSASEYKGLVDEAVTRRGEFDATLASIMVKLEEIENKCSETEQQSMGVQERVEAVRVSPHEAERVLNQ